jgi:diadenosine tetraphosphatase ApaH/serine/threonine PP2A family protein phosphatase
METCEITLLGNHDQGAMFDPDGFNIGAERAIFWTREQLESPGDRINNQKRWEFLGELPRSHRLGEFLFVHGSPRNPLSEYIFPEDIYNHRKMERLFQLVGRYCFQGHTHVPGIFTESYQFFAPEEIDLEYTLGEGKVMVNVGSVGQPRDGDNRACYVILEDGLGDDSSNGAIEHAAETAGPSVVRPKLVYRRLPYDFETTIQKIYGISELEPFLGDRLRQGR